MISVRGRNLHGSRSTRITVRVALFWAPFLLWAGCSSGSDESDSAISQATTVSEGATSAVAEPPDESALAESLLLTVQDFPVGWSEQAEEDEEEGLIERCSDETDLDVGRTGRAATGSFSSSNLPEIEHSVVVYASNDALNVAIDAAISEERFQCVVDRINDGEIDTEDFEYGDASFGPISFPQMGDRVVATRVQVTGRAREQSLVNEADVYIDLILVANGRIGYQIVASDVLSPMDPALLEEIVRKANTKVSSAAQ